MQIFPRRILDLVLAIRRAGQVQSPTVVNPPLKAEGQKQDLLL